jgi:pimeloyl-ACP methyl ester carboxylesterase
VPVLDVPQTRYAKTDDDVHIAYQVVGAGERDLVLVEGFVSHVEIAWEDPHLAAFLRRLASFTRLIVFDKRGVGVSDRVPAVPTLEQRMDDVRAVMDAAGSERAVLMGLSEGAPLSIVFAATYPERVQALVLNGGMARSTWAPDYPWAPPADALLEAATFIEPGLFTGDDVEIWAPSLADDQRTMEWLGKYRRSAVSPGSLAQLFTMFLDIDVRAVLPAIAVPTLVLHRRGDRVVNRRAGQWMAEQIPGARYVELPGLDHFPWVGDSDAIVDEVEEFLTGVRHVAEPDRVLATVLFTDIVGSTERASELGDHAWRQLLDRHDAVVRAHLERFRGTEVKTTGDGFLATFDGPARAIQCAMELTVALQALGIEIRAGLHTGEVEVRGDDVGGIAVHTAARVLAEAQAGEVLVSRTVTDLVAGSGIAFVDRGSHVLKGIVGAWQLFAVQE